MGEPSNIVVRVDHLPPPGPIGQDVYAYPAEALVPLQPGEIRVETLFAAVDAGARAMIDPHAAYPMKLRPGNRVPTSAIVGRVVESRNPAFRDGDHVRAFLTVRQRFLVLDPATPHHDVKRVDPADGPLHLHLGALGMTGFTAWLGITEIGRPHGGETVLVSAAAGAVGSVAGQLAKAAGARVVGIAGGTEKCRAVVERFGFAACVDYKSPDFVAALAEACPDGVDVYFENVGGAVQRAAFGLMNVFGRVVLCGQVSGYSGDGAEGGGPDLMIAIGKRLTLRGYLSSDHLAEFPRFEAEMLQRVRDGSVVPSATITGGLTNLHEAVNSLTGGRNIGQQIHQMAD
ncbi:MDR family NADP-dependent oxidoreductase [Sphingomonas immobilis]|uniref:NADP-dependent oxidoreductase n=1 Tax=Sphingomonas immobilis TaxID=3063997 RepID=A0ABT8ZXR6_9SPHN|nr:NADP-dependent oxidoreductase [Sphingomonas sp. CA1-15]MDO7842088.1 NADP-dependent oxidoreductase [Sphingomonas sp. CA1-15]